MRLSLIYYYKGSTNSYLYLRQIDNVIGLYTDYNECITTIQTGYELKRVIEDLSNGIMA